MGKRHEQIFHQKGDTDGKAHEKPSNIISHQGNAN